MLALLVVYTKLLSNPPLPLLFFCAADADDGDKGPTGSQPQTSISISIKSARAPAASLTRPSLLLPLPRASFVSNPMFVGSSLEEPDSAPSPGASAVEFENPSANAYWDGDAEADAEGEGEGEDEDGGISMGRIYKNTRTSLSLPLPLGVGVRQEADSDTASARL